MKPHGANKSPEYHFDMAGQYLYNATRSLAAADGQLDQFKAWCADDHVTEVPEYLAALAMWHTTKQWPWQTPGPQGARVNEALPRD